MDTVNLVVTRLHHDLRLLRHVDYVMSDLWRVWNNQLHRFIPEEKHTGFYPTSLR